jgi:biopolymer transport protein ExbD
MPSRITEQRSRTVGSFNMTPIIDIVFLLIIFFLVVCRFIEAENFSVTVPHGCRFADKSTESGTASATVTVMKTTEGKADFAVGAEKIPASDYPDTPPKQHIVRELAHLIDIRLNDLPADNRVVTLRIDADICFDRAQYALAGAAASSATDIQLAVLKNNRTNTE